MQSSGSKPQTMALNTVALCDYCGSVLMPFDAGLVGGSILVCVSSIDPRCDREYRGLHLRRDELARTPYQELRRSKFLPFLHQFEGVHRIINPWLLLADSMGVAKTKQVIDAAQIMFVRNDLDRVIVIPPAGVRPTWCDPLIGELKRHAWDELPMLVTEYASVIRQWKTGYPKEGQPSRVLKFIISNYETIRIPGRVEQLFPYCGTRVLLVLDESAAVKNPKSQQAKACLALRRRCGRIVELNGTPDGEGPEDLLNQANLLSPSILECGSLTQFRARYATMEPARGPGGKPLINKWGKAIERVKSWNPEGLADIQKRMAPHVLRRMKADCLDLPAKLPTVPIIVTLTPHTWSIYKEMRDECLAWLSVKDVSLSPQAAVKLMRLSQITSGFLGGVEENTIGEREADLDLLGQAPLEMAEPSVPKEKKAVPIGREKLDALIDRLHAWIDTDPAFKVMLWSAHRFEILRTADVLALTFPGLSVATIIGNQPRADRERAIRMLTPETAPKGPAAVVGSPAAGGKGLTLVAASVMSYLSNGWERVLRLQSEDRLHRVGQRKVVSCFDFVAVGPKGQKTIDHVKIQALAAKEDLSELTTGGWASRIRETE